MKKSIYFVYIHIMQLRYKPCFLNCSGQHYSSLVLYKSLNNLITLEMPTYITTTTTMIPHSTKFQHPLHFNIPTDRTAI